MLWLPEPRANKKNDHEQTPDQDHVLVWRDLPVGFEDPLRQIVVLQFVPTFALHGLSLVVQRTACNATAREYSSRMGFSPS